MAPTPTTSSLASTLRRMSRRHGLPLELPPTRPAEQLEALTSFAGSVQVAELLARPTPEPVDDVRSDDGTFLRAEAERELTSLRRWVARCFLPAARAGRGGLPTPAKVHTAIVEARLLPGRDAASVAVEADRLGAPATALLLRVARTIQNDCLRLRFDLAPGLRALGPAAVAFEALDDAIVRGTKTATAERIEGLADRVDVCFAAGFGKALEALADDATCDDLAPWLESGGFLFAHLADCEAIATALLDHERAKLLALIDGCIGHPESEPE